MGFRNGAFAKVWEIKPGNGNFVDARISISRKDKQSDQYVQDFGSWVRFIGTAYEKACSMLTDGDRIKILECDVSNRYDKSKNETYINFKIFDYEEVDENGESVDSKNHGYSTSSDNEGFMNIPDDDDETPFQ